RRCSTPGRRARPAPRSSTRQSRCGRGGEGEVASACDAPFAAAKIYAARRSAAALSLHSPRSVVVLALTVLFGFDLHQHPHPGGDTTLEAVIAHGQRVDVDRISRSELR